MNYTSITVFRDSENNDIVQILKGVLLEKKTLDNVHITNYDSSRKEGERELAQLYTVQKVNSDVVDTLQSAVVRTIYVNKVGKPVPSRIINYEYPHYR